MNSDYSASSDPAGPRGSATVRAGQLLRKRAAWMPPLLVGSIVVILLTAFYIGSVVNPLEHLHGLPVVIVNQDRGAVVGAQRTNLGQQVQSGLSRSTAVSSRLHMSDDTLQAAQQLMDSGGAYAAVVIPANFTTSLLELAGVKASTPGATRPEIAILTNQRAGTEGASLAAGVLQPALDAASRQIGSKLTASMPAGSATAVSRAFLADPVTVQTTPYRPLPNNSALGLSAFYTALLTLMCGFLGGTIVNSAVDASLGYAATEIGPRWRQLRPFSISRWQTLIIKWVIAAVAAGLLTGLMLIIAVAALGMDAPHPGLLWLLAWLAAASVAEGTIVLFAILGASVGPLIAILIFVYAGLAAGGGTVPLQALPTVLRWLSDIEPLRQILAGTRAVLYFDAQADAGLTRAVVAASAGLAFWLVLGTVLVRWYDHKGFSRLPGQQEDPVRQRLARNHGAKVAAEPSDPGTRERRPLALLLIGLALLIGEVIRHFGGPARPAARS